MKSMYRAVIIIAVFVFLLPLSVRSEIRPGSFELNPYLGYNFFESSQNLKNNLVYGARIGYNFTKYLGVEVAGQFLRTNVDDKTKTDNTEGQFGYPMDRVDLYFYHINAILHLIPEGRFNPFIVAGFGGAHYSPSISHGDMAALNIGLGTKFWLTDDIALRFDLQDYIVTEFSQETYNNVGVSAGIVFAFGGKPAPAPITKTEPPPPPPPPEPQKALKCVDVPTCCVLDSEGCPTDSDKDGVCDGCDKCPDTPAGCVVDTNGCPIDSDKDGIIDCKDKCPDTPEISKVDANGCPITAVIRLKVQFDYKKTTIKHEYYDEIKKLADFMKRHPNLDATIEGHTDNIASAKYNQGLSQRRAESVKKFLVEKEGIDANRLKAVGYGLTKPIATNDTEEGRYKNRRVEAHLEVHELRK
jgi:OOP family OmpA-OmpF porin